MFRIVNVRMLNKIVFRCKDQSIMKARKRYLFLVIKMKFCDDSRCNPIGETLNTRTGHNITRKTTLVICKHCILASNRCN